MAAMGILDTLDTIITVVEDNREVCATHLNNKLILTTFRIGHCYDNILIVIC